MTHVCNQCSRQGIHIFLIWLFGQPINRIMNDRGIHVRRMRLALQHLEAHAAHLLIHGLLHLAGHDHVDSDTQAEAMEALEIAALAKLGIADPYGDRN